MAVRAEAPAGVINPDDVSFMAGSGVVLEAQNLSEAERRIFDRDLKRLAKLFSRESRLDAVWLEDRDTYLWAASIAKKQLGGIPFVGLNAFGSGSFGMQPIRPIVPLNAQTWFRNRASTGWQSSDISVDLSTATGNARNTQNRVIMVIPKLANYAASPKTSQLRWAVGPTTYSVQVLDWQPLTNLYVVQLNGSVLIGKNGTANHDSYVEFTGLDGLAWLGLAFGTGDWMQQET